MKSDRWSLPLRCCPITLTAGEFNEWIAVIDAAASKKSRRCLTGEQQKKLLDMRADMLNYSRFDRRNQLAQLRLTVCELNAFQTVLKSISVQTVAKHGKDYFSEAADDPDCRQFIEACYHR